MEVCDHVSGRSSGDPVVVTAAHCLPCVPEAHPARHVQEETCEKLLGPLGAEPTVWATCLFADPVADIALLGSPDSPDLYDEANRYRELVWDRFALEIADAPRLGPDEKSSVALLSLDGEWLIHEATTMEHSHWLTFDHRNDPTKGGMSGSPILSLDGKALAVLSTGILSPLVWDCLPARFFR
jgi:hypothetical protein